MEHVDMRTAGAVVVVLGGCSFQSHSPAAPDAEVVSGDDAAGTSDASPVSPDAPASAPDPTACVSWFTWQPQQPNLTDPSWGVQLVDIAQHLPSQYGTQYWFPGDGMTSGHETTHGINAHLRNYEAPQGENAFYVLHDHAAFIAEPAMRKSDIAAYIPPSLRGDRYATYITGQTDWDDTPLYVFDEWVAYTNGAGVAVGQVQAGLYQGQWTDAVMGPLEFVVYAIATARAASVKDPAYFASNTQFECFTAWNIARAMRVFQAGRSMSQFTWTHQDDYAASLRTAADAADLRAFARTTWGAAWTQQVLGF
jgi:hypothetical protein